MKMSGSWFTVAVFMMVSLTDRLSVLVRGELQDDMCLYTELSVLATFDGDNRTCSLPITGNNSTNSSKVDIHINNETSMETQISLIDTGYVSKATYESLSSAFNSILVPITSVLGLLGNILSLVTLVKQKPRDTITIYLISLCVADLLNIMCSLIISIHVIQLRFDSLVGNKIRLATFEVVDLFLSIIASRLSAGVTVALSLERMVAVKLPFAVKQTFLDRYPRKTVFAMFIFMVLFFVPNLFRFKVSIETQPVTNLSYVLISPSEFAKSSEFYIYLGISAQILTRILPMVIILVCNLVIIITLRASVRYRKEVTGNGASDHKTTRLLLIISAIFLFCSAPGTISGVVVKFVENYGFFKQEHYLYLILNDIDIYLDTFNSSINFVVYIFLGSNFRAAFFKTWRMVCGQSK